MIGIFGGTFDPIHFGHLRSALEVREVLGLDEVRFIPCGLPPHRGTPQATASQRLAMVRAALAGEPGFLVDDRELRRVGPSYMVDTLASLRQDYGTRPLCLLLGMDAFLGLEGWHRWQTLSTLAHLVIMHRPGWDWAAERVSTALSRLVAERRSDDPQYLMRQPAGRICFQGVTPLDISSSRLRALCAAGSDPRYLLPDGVRRVIKQQHIYDRGRHDNE